MLKIQVPDPSLILLIGSSGAGKSTFAARHFQPEQILSSDHCRAIICGDEGDQTVTRDAFRLLHQILRLRLARRQLTVIDATNLQTRSRRPLLRIARAHQLPVVAIVFNLSLETCLANNRRRPHRLVEAEALRQHCAELPRARLRLEREGYTRIYVLDETTIETVSIERLPAR